MSQRGVLERPPPTCDLGPARLRFQMGRVIRGIKEAPIAVGGPRICERQLAVAAAHDAEISTDASQTIVRDQDGFVIAAAAEQAIDGLQVHGDLQLPRKGRDLSQSLGVRRGHLRTLENEPSRSDQGADEITPRSLSPVAAPTPPAACSKMRKNGQLRLKPALASIAALDCVRLEAATELATLSQLVPRFRNAIAVTCSRRIGV